MSQESYSSSVGAAGCMYTSLGKSVVPNSTYVVPNYQYPPAYNTLAGSNCAGYSTMKDTPFFACRDQEPDCGVSMVERPTSGVLNAPSEKVESYRHIRMRRRR